MQLRTIALITLINSLLTYALTIPSSNFIAVLDKSASTGISGRAELLERLENETGLSNLSSKVVDFISIGSHFKSFIFSNLDLDTFKILQESSLISSIEDESGETTGSVFSDFGEAISAGEYAPDYTYPFAVDEPEEPVQNEDGYYVQQNAPRHLARLSSPTSIAYEKGPFNYTYASTGKGVRVYLLATGINPHQGREFDNRIGKQKTYKGGDEYNYDLVSWGTYLAGLIGSMTYGVAKKVLITPVKVVDQNGFWDNASFLSGIEYTVQEHLKAVESGKTKYDTAIMSFPSYSYFRDKLWFCTAIEAAYDSGLVVVANAGSNFRTSRTCSFPEKKMINVGAFNDYTDKILYDSNVGPGVDLFSSGVKVTSLNGGPLHFLPKNHYTVRTTSAASCAIVSGLAALLIEEGLPQDEIKSRIVDMAIEDAVKLNPISVPGFYDGLNNRVAYNGAPVSQYEE